MNTKLKQVFLTGIIFGLTSSVAMAADDAFYLAFDAGQGTEGSACALSSGSVTNLSCSESVSISKFSAGYQFQLRDSGKGTSFALEVGTSTFGQLNIKGLVNGSSFSGNQNITGQSITTLFFVPVNDSVSVIGKAGSFMSSVNTYLAVPGSGSSASTYRNITFEFGVGGAISLSPNLDLRVLYENYGNVKSYAGDSGTNLSSISGGVMLRFN
jgi:hypothetical protein